MNETRLLVKRYGLRKEEIASRVGVSYRTIERWYRGKTPPSLAIKS